MTVDGDIIVLDRKHSDQETDLKDQPNSYREISEQDLADVATLLTEGFPRRRLDYWRRGFRNMHALPPVPGYPRYGYVLEAGGQLQGVILLLTSQQGDAAPRSCLSSWYVREPYRTKAPILYKLATMHEAGPHVNLSPSAHVVRMITRAFGFRSYTSGVCLVDATAALRRASGWRLSRFETGMTRDLPTRVADLARRHLGYGCKVLLLDSQVASPELLIYRLKLVKEFIPCAQILHGTPDHVLAAAGPLMRHLLGQGILLAQVDVGEATDTAGFRCYPGRNVRYVKGGVPAVGDLLDSEFAVFGP